MKVFTIDADDNITAFADRSHVASVGEGVSIFASERELDKIVGEWPSSRMIEIWNSLPGVRPVTRFTSRQIAVKRIWKVIQNLEAPAPAPASVPGQRDGTKAAQVIALMRQPSGATLQAIMKLTGWQAHSVRGFISGHLVKKLGLRVRSFKRDGERVYKLRS